MSRPTGARHDPMKPMGLFFICICVTKVEVYKTLLLN